MASIASASPSSRHSFPMESGDDSDSWQYVESNPASVGFMPSPASSSMHSWGIVGYPNQMQASPVAMSPLQLDHDQARTMPPTSYPDSTSGTSMMASAGVDGQLMPAFNDHQFITGQEMMFNDQLSGELYHHNSTSHHRSASFNELQIWI